MERKWKITIIIIVTLGVIGGAIGLYFSISSGTDNECDKLNSKYNLTGNDKYIYQKAEDSDPSVPICCPNSCGKDFCGYIGKNPDNCTWVQKADEYDTPVYTPSQYTCEQILNSNNKELAKNACIIKE